MPMSSLASKQGPRYRHSDGEAEPYETIGVEKLTPIIGAEISGVDLASSLSNRTMDEIHRALAENLVIFFRDQHITPQQHLAAAASRLRPPVRRAAHSSRRTARAGRAGADEDLCRQGFTARQWRRLAHRRVLRPRAAD